MFVWQTEFLSIFWIQTNKSILKDSTINNVLYLKVPYQGFYLSEQQMLVSLTRM